MRVMLDFDLIETPDDDASIEIRDAKDRPVVASALAGKADILVTGDKDFFDVSIEGLRILHPIDFAEEFDSSKAANSSG